MGVVGISLFMLGGSSVGTTILLRRLGFRPRAAIAAGVGVALATVALAVGEFVVVLSNCLGEDNPDGPLSWPWSPRRQFCQAGSHQTTLVLYGLLLVPAAVVVVGNLLARRGRGRLSTALFAALLLLPFLPQIYYETLPFYRIDTYPILHAPVLRQADDGQLPRVCYLYGVVTGSSQIAESAGAERTCVDLSPTPEALSLTAAYDQGRTGYDLEWLGKNLTAHGIRAGTDTGVAGLAVIRVYTLPTAEAFKDATRIPGVV